MWNTAAIEQINPSASLWADQYVQNVDLLVQPQPDPYAQYNASFMTYEDQNIHIDNPHDIRSTPVVPSTCGPRTSQHEPIVLTPHGVYEQYPQPLISEISQTTLAANIDGQGSDNTHEYNLISPAPVEDAHISALQSTRAKRFQCIVCAAQFDSYVYLVQHAHLNRHSTIKCPVQTCDFRACLRGKELFPHMLTSHPEYYSCYQCKEIFKTQASLGEHVSESGHVGIRCSYEKCEKKFSRLDTYRRHFKSHHEDAKRFPCKYCKKYRGSDGFKREDHLTQHLRGYHHIGEVKAREWGFWEAYCKHNECPESRAVRAGRNRAFNTKAEYTSHMRKVHDESPFPCPEIGCDRVGGKGYFREVDLRKHMQKIHGTSDRALNDENSIDKEME